ncbi:MAG: sulfotransferase family protein, partial [Planctomycetota bacterium]
MRRWRKTVRRVLADPLNNSPIGRYISRNLDENGATAYLNRKVLISSQKKFIYLRLYKCACSKITGALIEDLTSRELSHRQDIHSVKWYGQVEKTVQIDENIEAVLADPTYFKFTFVRNPYERILSAWKNKIDNPEKYPDGREGDRQRSKINKKGERVSFEEFVNLLYEQRDRACSFDKHWAPQHYLLLLPFIEYDFIGRIETFSRDFENVLRKINAKPHLIEKIS